MKAQTSRGEDKRRIAGQRKATLADRASAADRWRIGRDEYSTADECAAAMLPGDRPLRHVRGAGWVPTMPAVPTVDELVRKGLATKHPDGKSTLSAEGQARIFAAMGVHHG